MWCPLEIINTKHKWRTEWPLEFATECEQCEHVVNTSQRDLETVFVLIKHIT